jgi:hypothetical protein
MVSSGALVLVIVMLRIEARARARDREVRAAFAAGVGLEPAMAPALPVVAAPVVAAPVVAAPVVAAPPPVAVQPVVAAPLVATPPGPRLLIRVGDAGVQVSIDGDAWEASSVDELREAGAALRDAGGSAIVTATDGTESTTKALGEIVSELRGAGVPTTITS